MTDRSHSATTRASRPALPHPAILILLALLLAFAITLSLYALGSELVPGDAWLLEQIQTVESNSLETLGDWLDWAGTGLGTSIPAVLIGAWLAWRRWWGYAALTIAAPVLSGIVNTALKALVDSPRPTEEFARITGEASGMGFPSGHAMRAMIFYGLIWVMATRLIQHNGLRHTVKAVAISLVVLHGLARIYIGVHWPSDVLGGYAWGLLVLAALATGYDLIASRTGWYATHRRESDQA